MNTFETPQSQETIPTAEEFVEAMDAITEQLLQTEKESNLEQQP